MFRRGRHQASWIWLKPGAGSIGSAVGITMSIGTAPSVMLHRNSGTKEKI